MHCTLPRPVSALVLALAAGTGLMTPCLAASPTLPPTQLAAIQAQKPVRTAQAITHLHQLRNQFGLDARTDFLPHQVLVNSQGRTVVRAHQTFDGRRVWGGEVITHVEAEGQVKALTQGLRSGVTLAGNTPKLSPEQARNIALRSLAPKGSLGAAPKIEQVVFPTTFTGGFATRVDSTRGTTVIDRDLSIFAKAPAGAYVLAYEVQTLLSNTKDGHKEINFIIDANTGAILRKWNAVQGDSPAAGTGKSFYRGDVPLSTAVAPDNTFSLRATDRGSLPNPFVAEQDPTAPAGLTMYYGIVDFNTYNYGFLPYQGHATNSWGNGTLMPLPINPTTWEPLLEFNADGTLAWWQGTMSEAGDTTAVDAHYGLSTTWDFYKNVFGRDGIDDKGTSPFAVVHAFQGNGIMLDNAFWAPWYFGMVFGEGSYPALPNGYMSAITEIDITGHELTHGITQYSAGLIYSQQSGGLNEATSDMLGKMVQAYADGGATGTTIPNFPGGDLNKWKIAHDSAAPGVDALRFMYKPSLDGMSTDCWYDGVDLLDVHLSSGAPNRFFYFLCEGASANASSATFSPYLPGGMTGIGNDKAARIWYKTLTEYLAPDADFEAARTASIAAAEELHGTGSPEATAVVKAWAAVNVGVAPGQPAPVRVSFPVVHPEGSFIDANAYPSGVLAKVQFFPVKTNVTVQATVTNTTNTKLTWSTPYWSTLEGIPAFAGRINPDGTWATPAFNFYYELLNIKVTSQADPNQFAKSQVLLVPADADTDNETDALDMGAAAMSWGLPATPNPAAWVAGSGDDWSIAFLAEALTNAFPAK
ncbi:MAG: M4 family metallopeptidase [Holophaga sp.]